MGSDSTCEFEGKRAPGPAVVPFSIQQIIDQWNSLTNDCPDVDPRQNVENEEAQEDKRKTSGISVEEALQKSSEARDVERMELKLKLQPIQEADRQEGIL
ncbi:hypothetical protein DL98DRAFT_587160 [Cadophora sp. DSE1049]|nr:hypothetical protein DL98DRAFT_587160 [Cadophora sp. DSE1049]